jgi:hypothetical protein
MNQGSGEQASVVMKKKQIYGIGTSNQSVPEMPIDIKS